MALSQPTLQDIQQQLDAISTLVDTLKPEMTKQDNAPALPTPVKHMHPREEFNGDLSRLAELTLIHLWTQNQLAGLYDQDCELCPGVDELCQDHLRPDVNTMLQDVAHLYWTLPKEVNCYQKAVLKTCMLDTLIACHAVTMPLFGTSDVLNTLHYMGGLGTFIAQDIFHEPVAALMAADTPEEPNQIRKKALVHIGHRIKRVFLPAGLETFHTKVTTIIKNPLSQKDKACTMYRLPEYAHQSKLPF